MNLKLIQRNVFKGFFKIKYNIKQYSFTLKKFYNIKIIQNITMSLVWVKLNSNSKILNSKIKKRWSLEKISLNIILTKSIGQEIFHNDNMHKRNSTR